MGRCSCGRRCFVAVAVAEKSEKLSLRSFLVRGAAFECDMATNAGDYWLRAGIALPPLSQPPSEEEIANLLAKYPIPATPFHWELVDRPPGNPPRSVV